jgi:hypothetical protein
VSTSTGDSGGIVSLRKKLFGAHPARNVGRLLTSQCHLSPILPTSHAPVIWGFDHSLRLYPAPDLVCIGGGGRKNDLYKGSDFDDAEDDDLEDDADRRKKKNNNNNNPSSTLSGSSQVALLAPFSASTQWSFLLYSPSEAKAEQMQVYDLMCI